MSTSRHSRTSLKALSTCHPNKQQAHARAQLARNLHQTTLDTDNQPHQRAAVEDGHQSQHPVPTTGLRHMRQPQNCCNNCTLIASASSTALAEPPPASILAYTRLTRDCAHTFGKPKTATTTHNSDVLAFCASSTALAEPPGDRIVVLVVQWLNTFVALAA